MNQPIIAPDMSQDEIARYIAGDVEEYRGYRIQPKRDFGRLGFWSARHRCTFNAGWVVTDGTCNVMPGATWAKTIDEAKAMIDDLIEAEGDGQRFWELNHARHALAA